ncbi:MAG: hypothetical protein ACJA2X_000224 [Halocynthiibacter sp.]
MARIFDDIRKGLNLLGILAWVALANTAAVRQASAEQSPISFGIEKGRVSPRLAPKVKDHAGIFMLDYQDIRLPGNESLDFLGYHLLSPLNDWLYFGIGSYAPFLKGEYGGFMAFGVKLHAQRKITDHIFVNGGFAFGGGGGGKSIAQSIKLSGTGGYLHSYIGLGYAFEKFSAGVNISHMKFHKSSIDSTQINVFLQRPFSYSTSPYGRHGDRVTPSTLPNSSAPLGDGYGSMIMAGLDNYAQINPQGSYKGLVGAVDLQYSKFMTKQRYWFYALGVGYKGLPTYNQAIGGIGYRFSLAPRITLYGQLGFGSGGYAPTLIDTGSGLLLYPKLAAEYRFNERLGFALTAGYSHAIDGTARNYTFGTALISHFRIANAATADSNAIQGQYKAFQFSLSHETAFNIRYKHLSSPPLNMLVIRGQKTLGTHFYVPLRAAISYQSYRGYPGYGEVSAGIGAISKNVAGARLQVFGELHVGANVQGPIARAAVGFEYGLSDELALRGFAAKTAGKTGFRSTSLGLGISRKFSLLNY